MDGLWLSFGLIFVAELGDKSQLMALTLATRYRALTILAAITAATAVVHLVSVGLGAAIGAAIGVVIGAAIGSPIDVGSVAGRGVERGDLIVPARGRCVVCRPPRVRPGHVGSPECRDIPVVLCGPA